MKLPATLKAKTRRAINCIAQKAERGEGRWGGMMWERGREQKPEEGDRLSEKDQRVRTQVEKVFKKREMCKGYLEQWLPTSSLDAPVTSSGTPTALTSV